MSLSLAFINLKGGVGKTAISVNFAAYCGLNDIKTLLIDLDPQTNTTFSCIEPETWQEHAIENGTVANLLGVRSHTNAEGENKSVEDVIIKNVFNNVDLIPSHLDLFTIDLDLAPTTARESKLSRSLKSILDDYEIIICDCPPNLTIPTQNALALCSHYAIPVNPDYLSGIGIGLLLERVEKFCDEMEKTMNLAGIIISRVGRPAIYRQQSIAAIRTQFGDSVLDSVISERAAVSEAAAKKHSVFESGNNDAIEEFTSVCEALLEKMDFQKG